MNKLTRWLPALVAPVVIVGGAIAVPSVASAASQLPAKSVLGRSSSTSFAATWAGVTSGASSFFRHPSRPCPCRSA